jgi:N-acetylmuramoyl-L-alanine amidase
MSYTTKHFSIFLFAGLFHIVGTIFTSSNEAKSPFAAFGHKGSPSLTEYTPGNGSKVLKVVLDAGHGGKDSGARGITYSEKRIALAIVLETGRLIQAEFPEVEVIYTRSTDIFVPLHERAAIANASKADMFISVHCNSLPSRQSHSGTETYVLGLKSKDENFDIAKLENAAILLEDDYKNQYEGFDLNNDEDHIMLSLSQNAYLDRSIFMASLVETSFEDQARRQSHGVKQAGFLVLRETAMPSILVETGFLSSDAEERFLGSEAGQQKIAASIANAFAQYKRAVDSEYADVVEAAPAPKPTVTPVIPKPKPQVVTVPRPNGGHDNGQGAETAAAAQQTQYRVQLAATSQKLDTTKEPWSKLKHVEIIREDALYKYYLGPFTNQQTADEALKNAKKQGFENAFIVTFKGGKRV